MIKRIQDRPTSKLKVFNREEDASEQEALYLKNVKQILDEDLYHEVIKNGHLNFYSARAVIDINGFVLTEYTAFNIVESKVDSNLDTITITSNVPVPGPEFNPEFDKEYTLNMLYGNIARSFYIKLIERKISESMSGPKNSNRMYQLLTFRLVQEIQEI